MLNPLPLLLPLLVLQGTSVSDETAERIARVEAGLRPPVLLQGESGWSLEERMHHYGVPAVGIAVIDDGQIAWHKVYGKSDAKSGALATTETLFQAASISKPLAAMGALKLAAAKGASIDEDVNAKLRGWKLPTNALTEANPVTLALLLCHRAGTTVHGFGGYPQGTELPTVPEILDGKGPANSPAVRVARAPGSEFDYSGGGYTIAQAWMMDVSGKAFAPLMEELVLGPAGMKSSTYAQPLPNVLHARAAAGVPPSGVPVPGGWHVYPEQAAAGLWTTAADLARLLIEVQQALQGKSEALSQDLAERLVPGDGETIGLGFFTRPREGHIYFGHGGWNEGFSSEMIAHRDAGYGAVVMTNGNQPALVEEILQAIRVEYDWAATKVHVPQPVPEEMLARNAGRYRFNSEQAIEVRAAGGSLQLAISKGPATELAHVGEGVFLHPEEGTEITFHETSVGLALRAAEMGVFRRLAEGERMPRELLLEGAFDEALAAYRDLQTKNGGAEAVAEEALNNDGYELLGSGRASEAVLLFRINAALYPKSANAWDSLGEGYRTLGDASRAIEAYEAALKIDSAFPTAIRALAELKRE